MFSVHGIDVSAGGLFLGIAAVVGLRIFVRGITTATTRAVAERIGVAGIAGGLIGAKCVWVLTTTEAEPFTLFGRAGYSWYGGLAGGALLAAIVTTAHSVSVLKAAAAAVPALALAQAVCRVGCFLEGDDYGRPTDLPWGVSFPHGNPPTDVAVHPTQLYEFVGLLLIFGLLRRMRRLPEHPSMPEWQVQASLVGAYMLCAGGLRLSVESVRPSPPLVGGLSLAQSFAAVQLALGLLAVTVTWGAGGKRLYRNIGSES
jgi:phosphatidylglycerol:prolipoprotein diacylglycerol transferase